jgi:hypothetical protein
VWRKKNLEGSDIYKRFRNMDTELDIRRRVGCKNNREK